MKIKGRLVELSEGRIVFLAKVPDRPDAFCIAFKNKNGQDRCLVLSNEALNTLTMMYSNQVVGLPEREFPYTMRYEVINNEKRPAIKKAKQESRS